MKGLGGIAPPPTLYVKKRPGCCFIFHARKYMLLMYCAMYMLNIFCSREIMCVLVLLVFIIG